MYEINTPWTLWYHSVKDKDWSHKSYKQIYKIDNLHDLYNYHSITETNHLQNGIYFLMRQDIFPTWEDPENRQGCCISFKIPCSFIQQEWCNIINRCVSEDILKDPDKYKELNGISFSPKKEFNILKIWLRSDIKGNMDLYKQLCKEYKPYLVTSSSLYKTNLI